MKTIIKIITCLVLTAPLFALEMMMEVKLAEVCCIGCVQKLKAVKLKGVQEVHEFVKPGLTQLKLKKSARIPEVLQSIADSDYTVEESYLLLLDAKLKKNKGKTEIAMPLGNLCTVGITERDLKKDPWFKGELFTSRDGTICLRKVSSL